MSFSKALAAAATPQPIVAGGHQMKQREGAPEIDPDHMIQKVGEGKKAVEMTMRFFAFQVATSSISNILGTVLGHPLDTIRVSLSQFSPQWNKSYMMSSFISADLIDGP